jgi:hypothetical protein
MCIEGREFPAYIRECSGEGKNSSWNTIWKERGREGWAGEVARRGGGTREVPKIVANRKIEKVMSRIFNAVALKTEALLAPQADRKVPGIGECRRGGSQGRTQPLRFASG